MEKQRRLQEVEAKKNDLRMKMTQRKITETLTKIPRQKQKTFLAETDEKRRRELKEMKENLWRKWGRKKPEKKHKEDKEIQKKLEENLRMLEGILEQKRK